MKKNPLIVWSLGFFFFREWSELGNFFLEVSENRTKRTNMSVVSWQTPTRSFWRFWFWAQRFYSADCSLALSTFSRLLLFFRIFSGCCCVFCRHGAPPPPPPPPPPSPPLSSGISRNQGMYWMWNSGEVLHSLCCFWGSLSDTPALFFQCDPSFFFFFCISAMGRVDCKTCAFRRWKLVAEKSSVGSFALCLIVWDYVCLLTSKLGMHR